MVTEPHLPIPTTPQIAIKEPLNKPKRPPGWISLEGLGKVAKAGIVLILLGIVAILTVLIIEERSGSKSAPTVFLSLLEKVGEALVIAGAIDIVIHLRDWNDYFMERLRDAIIHQSYLKRLDPLALRDLIGRAFRAQLDNPSISADNKAGFLDYFFSDIQQFIGEPFRENVVAEFTARRQAGGRLLIEDNLTYICRESKGEIQKEVRWSNEEGEIENISLLRISVRRSNSKTESVLYDSQDPTDLARKPLSAQSLLVEEKIPEADRVDGLLVMVSAKYVIRADRFQYWTMSHLTKNLSLSLRFPEDYDVQLATFGMKEESLATFKGLDHRSVRYTSWLLPDTGMSWTFNSRPAIQPTTHADAAAPPLPAAGVDSGPPAAASSHRGP
jgi:hypothetical protein